MSNPWEGIKEGGLRNWEPAEWRGLFEIRNAYEAISRVYPETGEGLLKKVGDLIRGLNLRIVLDIGAGANGNLEAASRLHHYRWITQ